MKVSGITVLSCEKCQITEAIFPKLASLIDLIEAGAGPQFRWDATSWSANTLN